MAKTKQVYVDYELPEAMLKDANKIIVHNFPEWIAKIQSNKIAAFRLLFAGWLFLKYEDGIAAKYDGQFPGVTYQQYDAMDRPVTFQSVMLKSEYDDAMARMERLYPNVYNDKAKDNNYFLAVLGYAALRELWSGRLILNSVDGAKKLINESPEEYAKKNAEFKIDLINNPQTQIDYIWLEDNPFRDFNIHDLKEQEN